MTTSSTDNLHETSDVGFWSVQSGAKPKVLSRFIFGMANANRETESRLGSDPLDGALQGVPRSQHAASSAARERTARLTAAGHRVQSGLAVPDRVRSDVVHAAQTWVVKVGTSVLTGEDGTLDSARIDRLAEQISVVMDTGRKVALVSSGAVGAGMGQLGWKRRPDNLRQLQAAAAVGQAFLIRAYDEGLRRHRRHAAQLLLTHEDFDSRPRYLNMRNTLHALFECDAVPIINENDTISVDEIKLGDNDQLAAMVTNLLQAPLLVILSVVDGLYRADPEKSVVSEVVPVVPQIDDEVLGLAGDSRSLLGTGGMQSKLAAARRVTHAGGSVIITSGVAPAPLTRILAGEPVGTLFLAHGARHRARKRWIGLTARTRGHYVVDAGARHALESGSKSLLAIGIVDVIGDFEKGDVVGICDGAGQEFARGLTNYSTSDARRIRGLRTHDARVALGSTAYDEVIHRDNLALIV
jgi:glutamate 5-kinase